MSTAKNSKPAPKKPGPAPFDLKGSVSSLANRLNEAQPGEKIVDIPLDKVCPNPKQHRKYFDSAALQELADSIGANGQELPAVVRPNPDPKGPPYILISGERRWRACRLAGKPTLRCVVRQVNADDQEQILVSEAIENWNREGLALDEEISLAADLIALIGLDKAVKRTGKRKDLLSRMNTVAKAPEMVQRALKGKIAEDIQTLHRLALLAKEAPAEAKRLVDLWESDPAKAVSVRDQIDAARERIANPPAPDSDRQNNAKDPAAAGKGSGDSSASHSGAGGAGAPPGPAVRPGSSQGESAGRSAAAQRSERGDGNRSESGGARASSGTSGGLIHVPTSADFRETVIVLQTNVGPIWFDRNALSQVLGLDD